MLTTLRRMFRADSPRRPRPPRARLGVEALEGRAVPAATAYGAAFDVATDAFLTDGRTVARADNGNFAETWAGSDGIYVRLYNSAGTPLSAAQKVVGTTLNYDVNPTIAMSPGGKFVVAWTNVFDFAQNDYDVRAQLYNASGAAVGGTIPIAQGEGREGDATAGMDAAGNFAVAYEYGYTYGSPGAEGIRVAQFNSLGHFVRDFVAVNGPKKEANPSLDMNPAGQFVVSYTLDYSADDKDIWARRYNSAGTLLASTGVAVSLRHEYDSSAAIDDAGDVVVSYTRYENGYDRVFAQRVATSGLNLGAPIALPLNGYGDNTGSSVDMDHAGNFVVAYTHWYGTVGAASSDVLAQQFGWNGAAQSGTIYVTSGTDAYEDYVSVAVGNGGNFVVNYYSEDRSASVKTRIYYTPFTWYPPPGGVYWY